LVATLLSGCGHPVTGSPPVGVSEPVPVQWGSCASPPDAEAQPEIECGEVSVPLDYSKPDGARATIAVARVPATGDKIGSLVLNPGGPGYGGVDFLWGVLKDVPAKLRERFDLVGFDPRGVGRSTPAIDCNSDAQDDADRAKPGTEITGIGTVVDNTPAGVAAEDKETEAYVQRCIDKTGEELLANVGTESVARDMDVLRAALGDEKLTYLGYSYGTAIGSRYAELFEDRVRAMVLDGAMDPAVDPLRNYLHQFEAFQKAFDVYAADCARNPHCPLGTDPGKAVESFNAMLDPLVDHPAPTKDPRGLGYNDAVAAVFDALYLPAYWKPLTNGLAALRDGGPADILLALADDYNGRGRGGHYDNSVDAYNAISCADAEQPRDEAAWVEYDRQHRQVSPFVSYGEFSGHAPRGVCAFWPVAADGVPHAVSATDLPPTLVISTTGDPATPYIDGVHLAEQMHAALLTVDDTRHTASFYGIRCIDDIVTAYLIRLALPPADKRCSIH
jgi:pimeloyl-ACP methyl ester carboxylesterase